MLVNTNRDFQPHMATDAIPKQQGERTLHSAFYRVVWTQSMGHLNIPGLEPDVWRAFKIYPPLQSGWRQNPSQATATMLADLRN